MNSTFELVNVRAYVIRSVWVATLESAELLVDGASSILTMPMSGWTRHDGKTGNGEFELYMPFELSSFAALPDAISGVYNRVDNLVVCLVCNIQ